MTGPSLSRRSLLWKGVERNRPRLEIAHVTVDGWQLCANGTQIGTTYELHYLLTPERLDLHVVGGAERSVDLDGADFFDLGFSPLFNSLPVLRDKLLEAQRAHDYVMQWVLVPDLEVERSEQSYKPVGPNTLLFVAGVFSSSLTYDDDGFIVNYPGLARRVGR
jgi:hypothetical protein